MAMAINEKMKKSVHFTLSKEVRDILKQAQKASKMKPAPSKSSLIEYAIKNVFKNKAEIIRDKMREHQQQLMMYKDQLKELIEEEKEKKVIDNE